MEFLFSGTPHIGRIVVSARRHPESLAEDIAAHVFPNFETFTEKIGSDRERIHESLVIPLVREDIRGVKRFAVKTEGALLPMYR